MWAIISSLNHSWRFHNLRSTVNHLQKLSLDYQSIFPLQCLAYFRLPKAWQLHCRLSWLSSDQLPLHYFISELGRLVAVAFYRGDKSSENRREVLIHMIVHEHAAGPACE